MKKKRGLRLDGWKEIAGYLNRDARTVMRWEKELGLPVHRMEKKGKSSVYALAREIDTWLATKPLSGRKRKRALGIEKIWWLRHMITFCLVMVIVIFVIYPRMKTLPEPADFDISGSKLIILDKKGKKLWDYDAKRKLVTDKRVYTKDNYTLLFITDLDNDGTKEVLFTPRFYSPKQSHPPVATPLICFEGSGDVRFIMNPGRKIRYGKYTISVEYISGPIWLDDLDGNGEKEILLKTSHAVFFASQLIVLTSRGKVIGEFINGGHIQEPVLTKDLDNDGYKEIIICGINNTFDSNFLAVFDYRSVFGSSPAPGDPEHTSHELARGTMKYYIIVPKSELSALLDFYPNTHIAFGDNEVRLEGATSNLTRLPIDRDRVREAIFRFDYSLKLIGVEITGEFREAHQKLEEKGYLKPLPPNYPEELAKKVVWWDGDNWVSYPTITRMWKKWE
jgi:hypothetical protein